MTSLRPGRRDRADRSPLLRLNGEMQEPRRPDPRAISLEMLRIGMGIIWALNMVFIVLPSNQYFSTFASTARSFAPTSVGGPLLADFVGAHATVFAWGIAILTAYLSVALCLGLTTRWACSVGIIASVIFLGTQFASTFQTPGGTDVGPHPLYILVYLILLVGGAGRYWALDARLSASLRSRWPRLSQWLFGP